MTQSETITSRFIDLVDGIRYQSLPAVTKDVSKRVVLDTFAVALAGLDEAEGVGRITLEYVKEQGGAAFEFDPRDAGFDRDATAIGGDDFSLALREFAIGHLLKMFPDGRALVF